MTEHKHNFVPMDIRWIHEVDPQRHSTIPMRTDMPHIIIVACACGAVKFVDAFMMED